jgi:hypothetical protein
VERFPIDGVGPSHQFNISTLVEKVRSVGRRNNICFKSTMEGDTTNFMF